MLKTMYCSAITFMLVIGISAQVQAQRKLIPFEQHDAWGYRDDHGNIAIKPRYVIVCEFSQEGIAAVVDADGWAYIDSIGIILVRPFVVDNGPDYFHEGLARFTVDGKFGFFDRSGKKVIEPKFDFVLPFSESLAAICTSCTRKSDGEYSFMEGGRWGYIDTCGEIVIPEKFKRAMSFENGQAQVMSGGEWKCIDRNGEFSSSPTNDTGIKEEGVNKSYGFPEQKISGDSRATGYYASAYKADFRRCMKKVILEISKRVYLGEDCIPEEVNDAALKCHAEYFKAMKGGINITKEDILCALIDEKTRQKEFYRALRDLSESFQTYGIHFEICEQGYFTAETFWDTGLVAGCRVKVGEKAYLYAYPMVPAHTYDFMVPRSGPVAADILCINEAYMVFIQHDEDPGAHFWNVVNKLLGEPENIAYRIPNVHSALLYKNFLKLTVIEALSQPELEELRVEHGVCAIVYGDPHEFKGVIHTGKEQELPVLVRELDNW